MRSKSAKSTPSPKLQLLLKREGINSVAGLHNYLKTEYQTQTDSSFLVLKSSDLEIDPEFDLHGKVVKIENTILDVERINIQNAKSIEFVNCVFTGKLSIGQSSPGPVSVRLFRCVCMGRVSIAGLEVGAEVLIDTVNTPELSIVSCDIEKLHLTTCRIASMMMDSNKVALFDTFSNSFELFDLGNCGFRKVIFDHAQVPIMRQRGFVGAERQKRIHEKARDSFNPFKFVELPEIDDQLTRHERALKASTMQFLLDHTNVRVDRNAFSHVKYLVSIASESNLSVRLFNRLLGSFIKPRRLLGMIALVITLYAMVYATPACEFTVFNVSISKRTTRNLTIPESLYFSGVTFFTIGYGDMTPDGLTRAIAVSEAVVGVSLTSAFLVALTRKYLD